MVVPKTESSGDFHEGRAESREWREGNKCADAHQEGCFILVTVENSEERVVGITFYLLSPKINEAALSCAGRGMFSHGQKLRPVASSRSCAGYHLRMWM